MDIGKEKEKKRIEPIETPIPASTPKPARRTIPRKEPATTPVVTAPATPLPKTAPTVLDTAHAAPDVEVFLGGVPLAAVDVKHREENGWSADVSARAGIEIDGILATRKVQILLEYFSGHSPNGQFYTDKVQYIGLGTHFHF